MDTRMYNYLKGYRFFAQVADGIEDLAAREISALGAFDVKTVFRGLYFNTDKAGLYRINYLSRTITRVLAPLMSFDCHDTKYLYKMARSIPWPELFGVDKTFMVNSNVSNSRITHSQYAALVLKDAIVDTFNEWCTSRPNVERIKPDVVFNLHIHDNHAVIYLDASGGSLHRRGYRRNSTDAPMQETLAASIILLSGWDGLNPLYDPMCGSGTILCEALMHHCRIPAGYLRKTFGFEYLPDFDSGLWDTVRRQADREMRRLPQGLISGSDSSSEAIASARANASRLPGGRDIVLTKKRFQDIPGLTSMTIVTNPPYGLRLSRNQDMKAFMKEFGDFLKQRCTGSIAYVYFGDRSLLKSVGLRTSWKHPLKNGPLDGRLAAYELY
jgi:putative N6-adenine-specific DNA methylase